jgi:asparagine synthase (glutamine-hydrolysing)
MCGIVGIWNLNNQPVSKIILERFTDIIAHRGPDGNGFYIDSSANLGLGHRRLAILDTSDGGKQPMSFADERYWITYNGELYNFLELKMELEKAGYIFKTESDTEVILAGYHYWGEDCQLKFNGMWAFAIWDRDEQKLFISRDRFGVKPLFIFLITGILLSLPK